MEKKTNKPEWRKEKSLKGEETQLWQGKEKTETLLAPVTNFLDSFLHFASDTHNLFFFFFFHVCPCECLVHKDTTVHTGRSHTMGSTPCFYFHCLGDLVGFLCLAADRDSLTL